jgi:pyridoxal biosynthesis lyase PdxS
MALEKYLRIYMPKWSCRMADPSKVREIIDTVSIPVMAKVRIGHFVEA